MTHPGGPVAAPTGEVVSVGPGEGVRGQQRSLRPAAVLLLTLGAAGVLLAVVMARFLGVSRDGGTSSVALFLVPPLGGFVMTVGVAALLLAGSRGARLVGVLTAVGVGLQTAAPLLAARPLGWGVSAAAGAVALLAVAAGAAALVGGPAADHPRTDR